MPKMKTHSGAKKRFRVTAKGKVKAKKSYCRHMMTNKPKSMKRKIRGMDFISEESAETILRNWLPYARRKKRKGAAKPAAKTVEGGK